MMRQSAWIVLLAGITGLAGCTGKTSPADDGNVKILCSFYPMYLFTKNVVGETPGVSVELMLPAQMGCPHDYDLSPDDVKRIGNSEVYVMNGAGLESFGVKQVKEANPYIVIVDTSEGIEMLGHDHDDHDHAHDHNHDHAHESGSGHGDGSGHGHDHDHAHDHEHGHSHEGGGNPHFFSSPVSAAQQVKTIGEALAKLDTKNAEKYRLNAASYAKKLEGVAAQFKEASNDFKRSEIVTMHEVFDYLARDSGLKVVATIFPVAGHDPSPAEVRKVIDTIRETKAAAVFTEPQYPSKLGETIATEAGVPVGVLDPVASGPADAPNDYYEKTMEANLETLKKHLSANGS